MPSEVIHYKTIDKIAFCDLSPNFYPNANSKKKGHINKLDNPKLPEDFCPLCNQRLIDLKVIDAPE